MFAQLPLVSYNLEKDLTVVFNEVELETQRIPQETEPINEKQINQRLQPGINLADRYQIQGVIGTGGMGAVYRARDLHFPNVTKLVAVKEMIIQTPDPSVQQIVIRNFEREANLLATLEHRAIPRIYDYFTIQKRSYLIIEYVNGKDLELIINHYERFLPEDRVIGWAVELCEVLEYLHAHKPEPIIFRDIKPSNVMINSQGHVVLVDFGIAKHFQAGEKGTMIGTEGYSPPEQYRGEATPAADIYALGATLHHALSRRDPRLEPPFSFSERPLKSINPAISNELEAIINKALQYNPQDRFQTITEFKEALLSVAQHIGIINQIPRPVAQKSSESELKPLWSFTCEDEVRGSPLYHNGVLYVGCYDNNLYAINAQTGEFIWKYPTEGGIVSKPALYENNLYFGSEDHRLHIVQAQYGRLSWTYNTEGPVRSSPRISEAHAFVGSDDGLLHAVNTLARRRAWVFDAGTAVRSSPLIENELVYFGNEDGDFFCLDLRGAVKWRFKAKRAITSSPVIVQGVVYFASMDANLYALDARTGWVIWRFRLGKPSISTPFVKDNHIYIGAVDGKIVAVELKSAKEIWNFECGHQVTGSLQLSTATVFIVAR